MSHFRIFLSIVISTLNKREYLKTTLLGLNKHARTPTFEVILVIDGSQDGSYEMVMELQLTYPIKVIVNQEKLGLATSRNIGIKHSNTEHILFLDDDIILKKNFLKNLYTYLQTSPDSIHSGNLYKVNYDFVSSLLIDKKRDELFEDDNLQIHTYFDPIYEPLKLIGRNYNMKDCACWWGLVTGANICISKKYLTQIGLFDETLVTWGPEDVDICYRAFKSGIQLIYHEDNCLYHLDHQRNVDVISNSMITNVLKIVKKHKRPPELEAYIRFFNGVISLNTFNKKCAEVNNMPSIELEDYYINLNSYIKKQQIIKYKRDYD